MSKDSTNLHPLWSIHEGEGPLFATALHAGHDIRDEMAELMALHESSRLREEDPYTDRLARMVPNHIIPLRSRFEVDLNRARDEAVYLNPEDAWGLKVWRHRPTPLMIKHSLLEFDTFYAITRQLLRRLEQDYGHFVILELHSYNHMRNGPNAPPDDPATHPDVNVGTGTMERARWARIIDRFIRDLRAYNYVDGHLDVRENVKFKGRQFASWVHENFPYSGCVLSIDLKKIFMSEWSGAIDKTRFLSLFYALKSTLPGISEELQQL